jgi:hypothetical protein
MSGTRTVGLGLLALLLACTAYPPPSDGAEAGATHAPTTRSNAASSAARPPTTRLNAASTTAPNAARPPTTRSNGAQITTPKTAATPGLTAGYGGVSAADRREIRRAVAAVRAAAVRASSRSGGDALRPGAATTRALVDSLVRCATFEGQRYCLGTGWTEESQARVRSRTLALLDRTTARPGTSLATGDLSTYDALRRAVGMSPAALARAERSELTAAARSVAKVWLLRHEIEGVPLPRGFLARHPEVRRTTAAPARSLTAAGGGGVAKPKHWRDYPRRAAVLNPHHVAAQHRTYWCGPTTMQMIAWGWQHRWRSQQHWARRLGTTTDGTAITSMVSVVNHATGYDKPSYAGPYITLDIGRWSFGDWKLLIARHVVDYHAPVVLHPVLLQRFYPYLDHDGSGHFQVGRGYRKRHGKTPLLGYFEPWNQQRFHPDEPFIDRTQWRDAYKSYRANEAHFQHNIGV